MTQIASQTKRMHQSGQAMAEFVVSVSFVFLALFVLVPTFGKLMDMQFQTQMASRYVAWERSIWFDQGDEPDESVQSSKTWESVAIRTDDQILNAMRARFFNGNGAGMPTAIVDEDVMGSDQPTSPIWHYVQSKNSMYESTDFYDESTLSPRDTPSIAYRVIDVMDSAMSAVMRPVNKLLSNVVFENDDFLTLAQERRNYFRPVIVTSLNKANSHGGGTGVWDVDEDGNWGSGIEDAIFQYWDGKITMRSALVTDGWNTQSLSHYQNRSDDFVPSTLFDNALFNAVIDVASVLDPSIGDLAFGEVGIEPMPAENGEALSPECNSAGFCFYND